MSYAFDFAGQRFEARAAGALWWPARHTLIVADLHLGKAARLAQRGGPLLPPLDSAQTLARLGAEIEATGARRVISLGDAFDTDAAAGWLTPDEAARLRALAAGRDWLWVAGNHDPGADPGFGQHAADWAEAGLTFRHIAGAGPDLSGHYHPKARLAGRSRPAFLIGAAHLILPAFGTYTGGMEAEAQPLAGIVGPGLAVLTGPRVLVRPINR